MVGVVSGGRGAGSDLRAVCATNMFWHKRTVIPTTRSHDFWRPRAAASGVTLPHLREEGSHSSLQRTPPPLLTSTSFPFFWRRPADRQIPVPYITARLLAALAHLPARCKRAREQETSEHTASLKEGECRSSSTDAAKSATPGQAADAKATDAVKPFPSERSGKAKHLIELMRKILSRREKALIFTPYTKTQAMLVGIPVSMT